MDERWVQGEGVVVEELDGQLLLLRSGASDVVHLDPVATRVWAILEQPHSHGELAASLAAEFGVGQDQVMRDLVPLLALLQEQELLRVAP